VDVWQRILAVRSLVLSPQENMRSWLKYASLCSRSDYKHVARKILFNLMNIEESPQLSQPEVPDQIRIPAGVDPRVMYQYIKHVWVAGGKTSALSALHTFVEKFPAHGDPKLLARCYLKLGDWQDPATDEQMTDEVVGAVLRCYNAATEHDPNSYKAFHAYAL